LTFALTLEKETDLSLNTQRNTWTYLQWETIQPFGAGKVDFLHYQNLLCKHYCTLEAENKKKILT
jgi:hypothetical protein